MEQTKRSTFKLLFYLKKNEPKKNGMVAVMGRITIDGTPKSFGAKMEGDRPKQLGFKTRQGFGQERPGIKYHSEVR